MKCKIIDRSTICFDNLATPLQHTVDKRGIVLHLLVGFPLDVIPEVLDGVAVGGSCKISSHNTGALYFLHCLSDDNDDNRMFTCN